jgi:hypothetical protein
MKISERTKRERRENENRTKRERKENENSTKREPSIMRKEERGTPHNFMENA